MINRVIEFLIRVLRACCAEEPRPQLALGVGVASEDLPEWDSDEREALLAFLRSPTGRTLLLTLRHNEELLKANACEAAQPRVDHARGRAVGYREAIASLILLSAPEEGVATSYGRGGNDAAPNGQVEDFAEPSPRGVGELRNQLSHDS